MKTLVTINKDGDNVRISKVTAHGEEVLIPDVESKMLAMMLWQRLKVSDHLEHEPLFPSLNSLEKLVTSLVKELALHRVALERHSHAMENWQEKQSSKPPSVPRYAQ